MFYEVGTTRVPLAKTFKTLNTTQSSLYVYFLVLRFWLLRDFYDWGLSEFVLEIVYEIPSDYDAVILNPWVGRDIFKKLSWQVATVRENRDTSRLKVNATLVVTNYYRHPAVSKSVSNACNNTGLRFCPGGCAFGLRWRRSGFEPHRRRHSGENLVVTS